MQPRYPNPRRGSPHRRAAHPIATTTSLNSGDGPGPVVINALSLPIDANAFGADGEPAKPVTIEVIPAPSANGLLPSRNGRRQRILDAQQLAARLNSQATQARVDYDHKSEPQSPLFAGTTEAEGWLANYRANHRGGIDADAELGPNALERVRAKRYRYISPALLLSANDDVVGLSSVALVNNPNLPLDAPRLNSENDVKTQEQLDAEAAAAERVRKLNEREARLETRVLNAAESDVDAAIAAGRILPAQKDFYLGAITTHADGIEAGAEAFNAAFGAATAGGGPATAAPAVLTQRIGPTGQPASKPSAAYRTPTGWQAPSDERLELHALIADHASKRGIPYRQAAIEFGAIHGV